MNPESQPAISERHTLLRLLRRLFSRRVLRRILILAVWTLTLIALFYAEENWRGRRAWAQYRHRLEANREELDLKAFIPKPVPDDQNFASTPFVQSWFPRESPGGPDRRWADKFSLAEANIPKPGTKHRQLIDLGAWEKALDDVQGGKSVSGGTSKVGTSNEHSRAEAGRAVLAALKTNEAIFAELRTASEKPYARYPIGYNLENPWGIFLPHLPNLNAACRRLQLRAVAELAAGEPDSALKDVELLLYLVDSVKDETFLIGYVNRLSWIHFAIQPIWEGLGEHRWTELQLRVLQERLRQYDLLTDLKKPLAGERAAGILTTDLLFRQKYHFSDLFDPPGTSSFSLSFANLLGYLAPHGWYDQEKVNYCRLYDQQLEGTFDSRTKRIIPSQIETRAHELEKEVADKHLGKTVHAMLQHKTLAIMLLPGLTKLPLKTAMAQTALDQANLACALERYRLAQGRFPEKLDSLIPAYAAQLPKDLFTGEPYKYRLDPKTGFLLYSVGWNEKDDGGVAGKALFDEKNGDWAWEQTIER